MHEDHAFEAEAQRLLQMIVSGGQTGVDRAALDVAMSRGIRVSGWCPQGRRAEDGAIDPRYPLQETPSDEYAERTAWNVRDSDGTLILLYDRSSPGTTRTIEEVHMQGKPMLLVNLTLFPELIDTAGWIETNQIRVLNVAGPRESEAPGVYVEACAYLEELFGSQ
ncbi:MAG: putative molybdenum carrier protein [Rhodothermales bacterium]